MIDTLNIESDVIKTAINLLKKYGNNGLRTLDSIQLASALKIKEVNFTFLTSDKLLQKLFNNQKLDIIMYD